MSIRSYEINLDSFSSLIPEPIVGRQGDKNGAVTLYVTVTDRGGAVDLTEQTINLMAKTAKGTAIIADNAGVTITDAVNGKFTYEVPNALWSEAGKIKEAYFSLNGTDGQQTTYDLIFIVKKAIDIDQKHADDYVTIIDGTLRNLQSKVNAIDEAYKNGEFYSKSESDEKYQKEAQNYSTNQPNQFKALMSSFGGPNFNALDLYWSNDYEHFYPINKTKIDSLGTLRDPSISFIDGKFWVAYTWGLAYSTDLINFTKVPLPVINSSSAAINWAPEIVIDGSDFYIMGTSGTNGFWVPESDYKSYICKFDYTTLSFSAWQQMIYHNTNEYDNVIDNTATFYNGYWWLAMKYGYHYGLPDFSPKIQLYKGTSIMGEFDYVTDVPFSHHCEGPSLVVGDGKLYCYGDEFEDYSSYRMESSDGVTWENEINITAVDGSRTQHFTVTNISTDDEEKTIQKAISFYKPGVEGSGIANLRTSVPKTKIYAGVNDIYPRQGIEYHYRVSKSVESGSLVEVNIHTTQNMGYSKIFFEIEKQDGTITLRLNKSDGFLPPNGASMWQTTKYDAPVCLVTDGSDNSWVDNPAEPYKIVSAPIDISGGRNMAIGTREKFSFSGNGTNGQIVHEWALPEDLPSLAPAKSILRISFDLNITNYDGGKLYVGTLADDGIAGPWQATPLSATLQNGAQHVTELFSFNRSFVFGERLRMTLDGSKATYTISNVMFESGYYEHQHTAAPEDGEWRIRGLSSNYDLNNLTSSGKWSFGGTINFGHLPSTIAGQWRAGMVHQIDTGSGVIMQYIYTSSSEIFWRQKTGSDWGSWLRINATVV
ncbi:hypothetical protein C1940_00120 [Lactiplantibacillus plantarum subsp. plantarum]|uniref:BppU family phage baseplate upper protein n=1 Tax=Lactiplantibacillus plantarum TaxID=1590 RepID=UPI000CD356FC|nr:BppU family phage baseplate upper protein [Lactiplantibacillus plantarum]AUV70967.1 hypothetical protein C1940_00120 [Lactiplantibacillus plantarum subsp. plantarum]